jgi:hypothetical protein
MDLPNAARFRETSAGTPSCVVVASTVFVTVTVRVTVCVDGPWRTLPVATPAMTTARATPVNGGDRKCHARTDWHDAHRISFEMQSEDGILIVGRKSATVQ